MLVYFPRKICILAKANERCFSIIIIERNANERPLTHLFHLVVIKRRKRSVLMRMYRVCLSQFSSAVRSCLFALANYTAPCFLNSEVYPSQQKKVGSRDVPSVTSRSGHPSPASIFPVSECRNNFT